MNLEARKIEFIQEFLKLESEEKISQFENMLKKEKRSDDLDHLTPMTQDELEKRMDRSESDFQNNRYKESSELLDKYK